MTIETRPITDAIGLEILGVDLSQPVSDEDFNAIRQAWLKGTILLFRGQTRMTPAQHVAFSRRFGDLEIHHLKQYTLPDHPEIFVISNIKNEKGEYIGASGGGRQWHTDSHFLARPSMASLLHAKEVPPVGGNTMFANMYAAYDALTDEMRERIKDLKVLVSRVKEYEGNYPTRPPLTDEEKAALPDVVHPLVRTHPETGRKALYVGGNTSWEIVGMDFDEGRALLAELRTFATQDRFAYSHKWEVGDLVMWDNRCTMHSATMFDEQNHRRLMYRTTVAGDVPY